MPDTGFETGPWEESLSEYLRILQRKENNMKEFIVKTESGLLQGIHGWDPRIAVFKGVPYAKPPTGELRWRSPQPPEKWEGIRRADTYGPMAMQNVPGSNPEEFWTNEIHPTGPEFEMSEDCLYLNVFTPARTGEEKLPVLMYIHGGGFRGGYSYEVEFDWEHMARKGIVVVSIGYRLGIFGFMVHPWLSAEAPDSPKGNYGTEDQLAAIRWLRRNIAAFGGDPERITIAGQSAGAMSVQNLITSPLAEGLVKGGIAESGVLTGFKDFPRFVQVRTMEQKEPLGIKYLDLLGVKSLEEARAIPAQTLIDREDELLGPGIHFEPIVDGIIIKESTQEAFEKGNFLDIPVIAGFNRGEVSSFPQMIHNLEDLREFAKRSYGDKAEDFLAASGVKTDTDVERFMTSDAMLELVAATVLFGHLMERHGRKAYLYEFNADIPGEDNAGSYHGSEMWFAYDGLARCWRPFTGKHYDLARQMSSYWVNFVKTGDPNGCDTIGEPLPEWKAFSSENEFLMEFADKPKESGVKENEVLKLRLRHTLGE